MRRAWLGLPGALLLGTLVWAQSPAPPSCEQQVEAQYRQLVTDKVVAEGAAAWTPQLLSVVTTLRTGQTQYDIKKQQAELAERNVAQLLEQLRQTNQQLQVLQAQNAELRGEVEQLKNGGAASPKN